MHLSCLGCLLSLFLFFFSRSSFSFALYPFSLFFLHVCFLSLSISLSVAYRPHAFISLSHRRLGASIYPLPSLRYPLRTPVLPLPLHVIPVIPPTPPPDRLIYLLTHMYVRLRPERLRATCFCPTLRLPNVCSYIHEIRVSRFVYRRFCVDCYVLSGRMKRHRMKRH